METILQTTFSENLRNRYSSRRKAGSGGDVLESTETIGSDFRQRNVLFIRFSL